MQRTVTLTITVPDDYSDGVEDVTMAVNFDPPLENPPEPSISQHIVNVLLQAFEGEQMGSVQ